VSGEARNQANSQSRSHTIATVQAMGTGTQDPASRVPGLIVGGVGRSQPGIVDPRTAGGNRDQQGRLVPEVLDQPINRVDIGWLGRIVQHASMMAGNISGR
jgi:hypothetical protein